VCYGAVQWRYSAYTFIAVVNGATFADDDFMPGWLYGCRFPVPSGCRPLAAAAAAETATKAAAAAKAAADELAAAKAADGPSEADMRALYQASTLSYAALVKRCAGWVGSPAEHVTAVVHAVC
jgi:hypothetical protein